MNRRKSFCFSATTGTLYDDLRTFYCCRRHKSVTKSSLCHTHYHYVVDSDIIQQQYTKNALLPFPCNNGYANPPQCNLTHTWAIFFKRKPVFLIFSADFEYMFADCNLLQFVRSDFKNGSAFCSV